MASVEDLFKNQAPWIAYDTPEEEKTAVWAIQGALHQLESFVDDLRAAVDLYDHCAADRLNTPFKWPFLAAREGAMAILNFEIMMNLICGKGFKAAPSLRTKINHAAIKQARQHFRGSFPHATPIRHAVAHPELTTGNLTLEPGVFVADCLADRHYVTNLMGKRLSFELSHATLDKLDNVKRKFFSAFDPINAFIPITERLEPLTGSPKST